MKFKHRLYLSLRSRIRNSPRLYRAYRALRGGGDEKIFVDRATQLLIAGYPRSANSFTKFFLRELAPQLRLASNLHAICCFKDARRFNTPTLTLVREPLNAISSLVVLYHAQNAPAGPNPLYLELAIADYREFYACVLEQDWLQLIMNFETVTGDPARLVHQLRAALKLDVPADKEKIRLCRDRAIAKLHAFERKHDHPGMHNLADAEKEKLKATVQRQVRNHHDYQQVTELYRRVSALCKE